MNRYGRLISRLIRLERFEVSGLVTRSMFAALSVVLIGTAFGPAARAQSAGTWNKRGQAAELREDYDSAYEDYLKARQKSPKDMRYQTRVDRMRFQAAAQHVDRGRVLRQNGDLTGALQQITRALEIDPGNDAAVQEVKITVALDKSASGGSAAASPGAAATRAVLNEISSISGPVELKPLSDDLVTLRMTEDSKNIYTAVGKLVGLNVLFDPDYVSKRIPVDLNSVSLPDALRIVGTIAGTFYKVVTPDTIIVALNNRQKHQDLDDQVV